MSASHVVSFGMRMSGSSNLEVVASCRLRNNVKGQAVFVGSSVYQLVEMMVLLPVGSLISQILAEVRRASHHVYVSSIFSFEFE